MTEKNIISLNSSKIIIDCLGVLYLNNQTEYVNDFRKDLLSKTKKLELFLNKNFTYEEFVKEFNKIDEKIRINNLPIISTSSKADNIFNILRFWISYDLSLCYAYMYEPIKTVEYLEEAYLLSKELKDSTIGNILLKHNSYYQAQCLSIYKCEDLYKKIESILLDFIEIICKTKWQPDINKSISILKYYENDKSAMESFWKYRPQDLFQIKTKEQADNLLKYKRITLERYRATIKRLAKQNNNIIDAINYGNEFKKNNRFKRIDSNQNEQFFIKNNEYVPPSDWKSDRYYLLNSAQKKEYNELFYSDNPFTDIIFKYERVRTNEILLYFFNNPSELDDEELKNEILYFSNNNKYNFYILLKDFYDYLKSIDKVELRKKTNILLSLDTSKSLWLNNKYDSAYSNSYRIILSKGYFNFIKNTTEELSYLNKTGHFPPHTKQNYSEFLAAKKYFHQIMYESKEGKKYNDIWRSQFSPEEIIKICEDYIQNILDNKPRWSMFNKKTGYSEKRFQIGNVIDKLTGSCVRIKDWKKAIFWLDLFFYGDPIYRYGATKSIHEKLVKRYDNAKKKLNKS